MVSFRRKKIATKRFLNFVWKLTNSIKVKGGTFNQCKPYELGCKCLYGMEKVVSLAWNLEPIDFNIIQPTVRFMAVFFLCHHAMSFLHMTYAIKPPLNFDCCRCWCCCLSSRICETQSESRLTCAISFRVAQKLINETFTMSAPKQTVTVFSSSVSCEPSVTIWRSFESCNN